jgi:hypothetical protein
VNKYERERSTISKRMVIDKFKIIEETRNIKKDNKKEITP